MTNPKTTRLAALLIVLVLSVAVQAQESESSGIAGGFTNKPYESKAEVPGISVTAGGAYQTGLYTCGASYAYQIEVPPGTNGLTPVVGLSYNSHASGERISLLGSGWDLGMNYIGRDVNYTPDDLTDDKFNLVLNGQSFELVYSSFDGRYHTKTESHMYIEKGEYWVVKTKDGATYTFGSSPESETIANGRDYVWRWSLDKMEDTHGNHIYYYYRENPTVNDIGTVYPKAIVYNNDGRRTIEFIREDTDRPDAITVYDQGSKVRYSRRIKEILVKVDNELVRKYVFVYGNNTYGTKSLLKSITEYGNDGLTHLPSTTFTYQVSDGGWQSNSAWKAPVDLKSGLGVRLTDINGDGLVDILKSFENYGDSIKGAWINNGSTWIEDDTWEPPVFFDGWGSGGGFEIDYTLADVNGDGFVDIVGRGGAWINNKTGWEQDSAWVTPINLFGKHGVRVTDINGDGLPDITQRYLGCVGGDFHNTWINNGNGWENDSKWYSPEIFNACDGYRFLEYGATFGDVNGDGLVDILSSSAWINTGSGWERNTSWESPVALLGGEGVIVLDVNGDGLADIVKGLLRGVEDYHAWINNGTGWVEDSDWAPPDHFTYLSCSNYFESGITINDVNGDGLPDIVSSSKAWLNSNFDNLSPDKLTEIKNGFGGTTRIDYVPSTKFDNAGDDSIPDLGFPMMCVKSVTDDNEMVGSHNIVSNYTYNYANGSYDHEDKEFRGFGYVKEIDARDNIIEHWFHQDDARNGREYKTLLSDGSGNPYSGVENLWDYVDKGGYFEVELAQTDEYTYDGAAGNPNVARTQYRYDEYGNVLEADSLGDVGVSGDEKYAYNEYTYNPISWIIDRVKHSYLVAADGSKVSEGFYYYDGQGPNDPPVKGDLTKVIKWLDTGDNPVTYYAYDTFGNLISETDAEGRTTQYAYDGTGTYPEQMTNALGQTYNYVYDFGTGNIILGEDPNGFVTSYEYDVFGRKTMDIGMYDSPTYPTMETAYVMDGVAPEVVVTKAREEHNTAGTLDTYTFVDGLGRVIQIKTESEDPAKQIAMDMFYDELGRVSRQSVPYLASVSADYSAPVLSTRYTGLEYDALGRNTVTTNPDLSKKNKTFDHWTVTTADENSHSKVYRMDAYGRITAVEEKNGAETYTTGYDYNARDEIVSITDNLGNVYSFGYDTLGRKTRLDDPDMGNWTYGYDKVGNLIRQTDAKGVTINFEYDSLNRVTRKDYPTYADVTYTYDLETNGTLSEVSDSVGTTHFYYDQRLRKIGEDRTIDGQTWSTELTYDAMNRVTFQTNPDGEVVSYSYNGQGLSEGIAAGSNVVNNVDYNALSKPTLKEYGNDVSTGLVYNEDDFRLKSIRTSSLQDLYYQYDNVGNVIAITDGIEGSSQTFGYDDLDRLTSAIESGDGYNLAYEYASIGNVQGVSDLDGETTFSYASAGPHALSATDATEVNLPTASNPSVSPMSQAWDTSLTYSLEVNDLDADTVTVTLETLDPSSGAWESHGTRQIQGSGTADWSVRPFEEDDEGLTGRYKFVLNDGRGTVTTDEYSGPSVLDEDTTGPSFAGIVHGTSAKSDEWLSININLSDPSGISGRPKVYYGYDAGVDEGYPYAEMLPSASGYGGFIPSQGDANEGRTLYFNVIAYDNDNTKARGSSGVIGVAVEDDDSTPPVIYTPQYPLSMVSDNEINVIASILDYGSGVSGANLKYSYDKAGWQTVSGTATGDDWTFAIPAQGDSHENQPLYFHIEANDSDNSPATGTDNNGGTYYLTTIVDDDTSPPVIGPVSVNEENLPKDGVITPNETIRISWSLEDESGIGSTTLAVNGSQQTVSGSYYVLYTPPSKGDYSFVITATDNDNSQETSQLTGTFKVYPTGTVLITTFHDGSTSKRLNYNSTGSQNVYLSIEKVTPVLGLEFNITSLFGGGT